MIFLTLRTDKPEAEIGLYDDQKQLDYLKYLADRKLAETIHQKIQELLTNNNKKLRDIEGLVVYKGPGSFTGLRIGISVANALADSLKTPIIGQTTDKWIEDSLSQLKAGENDKQVIPEYGAMPNITKPRK